MKTVSLSVGDFALPAPREGSIDALSGYGRSTQLGIEIHQKIQRARSEECVGYESEVPVAGEFERDIFLFRVAGRIDGFFAQGVPRIEEIKSTFNARELAKRLRALPDEHPYCLQLRTYGYLHWRKTGQQPLLSFLLVSTRNFEREEVECPLDLPSYEQWLDRCLGELAQEARAAEKRAQRRRKTAEALAFPFAQPRLGQVELIATVVEGMSQGRRMLIQAPTGLGKTVGVLYPAMAKAVQAAGRVIRSETDRGLVVLMDNRFLLPSYIKSMPEDWFGTHPRELVSQNILREVREFWEQTYTKEATRQEMTRRG